MITDLEEKKIEVTARSKKLGYGYVTLDEKESKFRSISCPTIG